MSAGCGGGGGSHGGGGPDAGSSTYSNPSGKVPARLGVDIPTSLDIASSTTALRAAATCNGTYAQGEIDEATKHIQLVEGQAYMQMPFVDVMWAAVDDLTGGTFDNYYLEKDTFSLEVSAETQQKMLDELPNFPFFTQDQVPGPGLVIPNPRACLQQNLAGDYPFAIHLDRFGFADATAGCDDLDRYTTHYYWNADGSKFRVRVKLYIGFVPSPFFNYNYDNVPVSTADNVSGYITYDYDATADRQNLRLNAITVDVPNSITFSYEMTAALEGCGAMRCVGYQLGLNVLGDNGTLFSAFTGKADDTISLTTDRGVETAPSASAELGDAISDANGCVLFERPIQADGTLGPWTGTGDPTTEPYYQDVFVNGIDYNTTDVDLSGVSGLPQVFSDPPVLLLITRGGGDPAVEDDRLGEAGAIKMNNSNPALVPYFYWGDPTEVPAAEVYQLGWDGSAKALTYTALTGSVTVP